MKQKLAWLALPWGLAALILGVNWRADHPTPTKEDLAIRRLMAQCPRVEIDPSPFEDRHDSIWFSQADFKPFVDSFYISPPPFETDRPALDAKSVEIMSFLEKPRKDKVTGIDIHLSLDSHYATIFICNTTGSLSRPLYKVHPATVKYWMKILLTDTRSSPKVRALMIR